ncbi:hypothetical protein ACWCW7_15765 [Nocardia tengchongensis]
MGGDWLLGVAFGTTATAAASLDPVAGRVLPIGLPGGAGAVPLDADAVVSALRVVLHAGQVARNGQPPSGLALAYPDEWSHHAGMFQHAAAVVGYPANQVRLMPISTAAPHNREIYPEDNPASAVARGALLAATGPLAAAHPPPPSVPAWTPAPAGTTPPPQRPTWIWAAVFALVVVFAGGAATAAILLSGNDTATTSTGTTTQSATALQTTAPQTTTAVPATAGANPPPPEPTPTPSVEPPPPTTTPQPAPAATKPSDPEPAKPTTSEKPPPPKDTHDAIVRGYCQGFLNQVDKFPGGLPAMRAQMPAPLLGSPSDWNEAFDRAATGSCQ